MLKTTMKSCPCASGYGIELIVRHEAQFNESAPRSKAKVAASFNDCREPFVMQEPTETSCEPGPVFAAQNRQATASVSA